MCSVKSRVGTLGGPASSMSTLRPRSAASLATQPPLAPDPTMSTSYGMVSTRPTEITERQEPLSTGIITKEADIESKKVGLADFPRMAHPRRGQGGAPRCCLRLSVPRRDAASQQPHQEWNPRADYGHGEGLRRPTDGARHTKDIEGRDELGAERQHRHQQHRAARGGQREE